MTNGHLPHTAITSWSGFVYQGKVAIYHVLVSIENQETCTDDFVLQLDSLEDFAILDGAGSVISLHQVKAKKTQLYSGYRDDLEKLKLKADGFACNNARFHLAQEITDKAAHYISIDHSPVEIYQYDHLAQDDIADIFVKRFRSRNESELKALGFTNSAIRKINQILMSIEIRNLGQLASQEGIGIKTLETCYLPAMKNDLQANLTLFD